MDPVENARAVAQEVIAYAQQQGVDLESLREQFAFRDHGRWMELWRKDEMPCSGRAGEVEGTLHYSMQGTIKVLPNSLRESAGAFRGMWSEAGTFDSIDQAYAMLKAWLLDRKEIDELPQRCVRRFGI